MHRVGLQEGVFEPDGDKEEGHSLLFSGHTPAFRLGKVPRWLERKLEPDVPGEKEILIPDVKVGDIEEEGGVQRYRVT